MDRAIFPILELINSQLKDEGFLVIGVFGSRARGDFTPESDLDLLYRLEPRFLELHPGWSSALRLEEIRADLSQLTGLKVDLADLDALRPLSQKFILPETIHVAPV